MKKPIILYVLILILPALARSQVSMDQTYHDFGELYRGSWRVVEFNILNNSDKKLLILRADQDPELEIQFSTKTVDPGAYATIRIQVNPRTKGRFKKQINLWISTSMEPFPLELEGVVKELEPSFQPCPGFTHPDKIQPIQFTMTASVTDLATGLPVAHASLKMIRNGVALEEPLITNEEGKAARDIPLGLYYVVTNCDGYESREGSIYLNRNQSEVKVKLKPTVVVEKPLAEDVPKADAMVEPVPVKQPEQVALPVTDPGDFSVSDYAANNIVFLIDVSSSMRKEGRLDLLKASMLELVAILREIDKVSILTYTSTSKMVKKNNRGGRHISVIGIKNSERSAGQMREIAATGAGQYINIESYEDARQNLVKGIKAASWKGVAGQ